MGGLPGLMENRSSLYDAQELCSEQGRMVDFGIDMASGVYLFDGCSCENN